MRLLTAVGSNSHSTYVLFKSACNYRGLGGEIRLYCVINKSFWSPESPEGAESISFTWFGH